MIEDEGADVARNLELAHLGHGCAAQVVNVPVLLDLRRRGQTGFRFAQVRDVPFGIVPSGRRSRTGR